MADDFDALCENMPDWIDPVRLRRGQKFAVDNYAGVSFSEMLSLYALFAVSGDGLDALIYTRRSDTPYRAYRRYYSTADVVRSWLETDILTAGTKGNDNLRRVFRMHRQVQRDMSRRSDAEKRTGCAIPKAWCTALPALQKDFVAATAAAVPERHGTDDDRAETAFNQCHLSVTQFGFFGIAMVYPERFGIHNGTRRDMEDFVHLWRTIGYFMGVEDEYNFGRGTLDEVVDRSRWLIRALVVPKFREVGEKWEHMSRCMAEGMRMYVKRSMTFDASFCYLCDVFGMDVVTFKKGLGIRQRVLVWWTGFVMTHLMRYDFFRRRMNRIIFADLRKAAKDFKDDAAQCKLKKKVFEYESRS